MTSLADGVRSLVLWRQRHNHSRFRIRMGAGWHVAVYVAAQLVLQCVQVCDCLSEVCVLVGYSMLLYMYRSVIQ